MKKIILLLVIIVFFASCKKKTDPVNVKETPVVGATTILVDETVFPIMEDLLTVFESEYTRTKITLVSKPENEIINMLNADKAKIAIMLRDLDSTELNYYKSKSSIPRQTQFATDALAFITQAKTADTIIAMQDVLNVLQEKPNGKIKTLVFDNPNSSTVRLLKKEAGIQQLPKANVFSSGTNKAVIAYVAQNPGAVGVIGINWLLQPTQDVVPYLDEIKVLAVENVKVKEKNKYVKPNQTNIADASYPLTRKIFFINLQGTNGLGMGFASYVAGDKGQRIVLKSGLVPTRFPSREIAIRKNVEN